MFQKPTNVEEVDFEMFVHLMIENGKTADEAAMQAKVCRGLGSCTKIGGKFYSIKKPGPDQLCGGG